MFTTKVTAIVAMAAFVAGSFVASPELRAYAAATIGSEEIIDNSIRSIDIKNGQVRATDIAPDAVGASEIKGVSKLIFAECTDTNDEILVHINSVVDAVCEVKGTERGDNAIAVKNEGSNSCFKIIQVKTHPEQVNVSFTNTCTTDFALGTVELSIIVFKT